MNRKLIVASIVMFVSGCNGGSGDGSHLGAQIDGMGRPAINTALITTFASDAIRNGAEDNYNATDNSDRASFADTMGDQFAIYDSLVGTCGDNPLTNRASANPASGLATGADRYDFISSVFADDQLYINSSSGGSEAGQCAQYLAAELGAIGVAGLEADCGGRTLNYDVIQTTYSAVAVGAATGVDDGVASDNIRHSLTVFPFVSAPRS